MHDYLFQTQFNKNIYYFSGIEVLSTLALASTVETISKPALASPNVETMISKPPQASTSNAPGPNNLISGLY